MKDTSSAEAGKPMSLKRLDDPTSKDFWDFVERSTKDWRQQQPDWSRKLERENSTETERRLDKPEGDPLGRRRVC